MGADMYEFGDNDDTVDRVGEELDVSAWDDIDRVDRCEPEYIETQDVSEMVALMHPNGDVVAEMPRAVYDTLHPASSVADAEAMSGMPDLQSPSVDPAPPAELILSDEQEQALADARQHLFTYICGTAGVGKTAVARLLAQQRGTELTATTGIAAVNLGGVTINSLLKYVGTDVLKQKYMDGYIQSTIRKLARSGLTRIVLDEVSMLSGPALSYLVRAIIDVNDGKYPDAAELEGVGDDFNAEEHDDRKAATKYRVGLTLVGDFGQLPPVPDSDHKTGGKKPVEFAFEAPEWRLFADHTTKLTKIFRQDDVAFVSALHAVRRGDVRSALAFFTEEKFSLQLDDTFDGSTIFAKNDACDRFNYDRMSRLAGAMCSYPTERLGEQRPEWKKQIPDIVNIREGALVMVLANRYEYGDRGRKGRIIYSNGDLGHFLGKNANGETIVKLKRNGHEVVIEQVERENLIPLEPGRRKQIMAELELRFEYITDPITKELAIDEAKKRIIKEKFEVIGHVLYMPLRLAYGCTVHKTQGLTLDDVQVNIRDPFFQHPGMLFVALSRARTAKGLRIVGNQRGFAERCTVEPRVARWL